MKIKHHITRQVNNAKNTPLWKWAIVIFIIIAMPMFFTFADVMQTQQAVDFDNQEAVDATVNEE